jgi:hypothetical protein
LFEQDFPRGDVGRLVITHKDRLLRFGAELVFAMCEEFGTEVMIINQSPEEVSFEQELVSDMIELVTVFSARLYGARSRKNKKLIDGISQVVTQTQQENQLNKSGEKSRNRYIIQEKCSTVGLCLPLLMSKESPQQKMN